MNAVGIVFLTVEYVFLTYFSFNSGAFNLNFYATMYCINALGMTILATLSLCAMSYIHKNSKELEKLGIFANEWLFKIYTFCWIGAATSQICQAISYMIGEPASLT